MFVGDSSVKVRLHRMRCVAVRRSAEWHVRNAWYLMWMNPYAPALPPCFSCAWASLCLRMWCCVRPTLLCIIRARYGATCLRTITAAKNISRNVIITSTKLVRARFGCIQRLYVANVRCCH